MNQHVIHFCTCTWHNNCSSPLPANKHFPFDCSVPWHITATGKTWASITQLSHATFPAPTLSVISVTSSSNSHSQQWSIRFLMLLSMPQSQSYGKLQMTALMPRYYAPKKLAIGHSRNSFWSASSVSSLISRSKSITPPVLCPQHAFWEIAVLNIFNNISPCWIIMHTLFVDVP